MFVFAVVGSVDDLALDFLVVAFGRALSCAAASSMGCVLCM